MHLLDEAGIHSADISLVSHAGEEAEPDVDVSEGATVGGEIGAGLGAAGGLIAGLGIIAVPGLGAVFAAGWLFATAVGALAGAGVGAAAGSLVAGLTRAGIPEEDAHVVAESVRRGGAVVSARVDDAHVVAAAAILRHAEGSDIASRREAYQREGWQGFDERREPAKADADADRYPMVPPLV